MSMAASYVGVAQTSGKVGSRTLNVNIGLGTTKPAAPRCALASAQPCATRRAGPLVALVFPRLAPGKCLDGPCDGRGVSDRGAVGQGVVGPHPHEKNHPA